MQKSRPARASLFAPCLLPLASVPKTAGVHAGRKIQRRRCHDVVVFPLPVVPILTIILLNHILTCGKMNICYCVGFDCITHGVRCPLLRSAALGTSPTLTGLLWPGALLPSWRPAGGSLPVVLPASTSLSSTRLPVVRLLTLSPCSVLALPTIAVSGVPLLRSLCSPISILPVPTSVGALAVPCPSPSPFVCPAVPGR